MTDCSKNEQERLAECRTLQESATGETNKLELALCRNESHMTSENEVNVTLIYRRFTSMSHQN